MKGFQEMTGQDVAGADGGGWREEHGEKRREALLMAVGIQKLMGAAEQNGDGNGLRQHPAEQKPNDLGQAEAPDANGRKQEQIQKQSIGQQPESAGARFELSQLRADFFPIQTLADLLSDCL